MALLSAKKKKVKIELVHTWTTERKHEEQKKK